jgi:peptide/nickel transport system permease protein
LNGKGEAAGPKTGQSALEIQGNRLLHSIARSFRSTWKLYRQSKTGMAGLAIVIAFLVMAIFAPIISPYSPEFTAPVQDVFVADSVLLPLENRLNWTAPMGLTEDTKERALTRIMVYSKEGETRVWPVSPGFRPGSSNVGIVPEEVQIYALPDNATYLQYTHFTTSLFLVLKGTTLSEYTYNLIDTTVRYELPFVPRWHSNLWNSYTTVVQTARMALVFADEHGLWLIDKRPPNVVDPSTRTYTSNITVSNATIIGNPLVIDADFRNGSMIIVPTDIGLMAFRINVTRGSVTGYVNDVRIGGFMWRSPYEVEGVPFEPVVSDNMISFPYPEGATQEFGKTNIILGTTDSRLISFDRENGSVTYDVLLLLSGQRDLEITGVFPSPVPALVVGKTGSRSFLAGIEPDTGLVGYNSTQFGTYDGHFNSEPFFVPGLDTSLFSTDADKIYLVTPFMKINATFAAPGGGSETPVSFLGNIYLESSVTGNYFGVITQNNTLFVQTLTGVNVAPLPPGKYSSGNRYWLGTDYEGHDILAWLIYGTRAELLVGVTAAFFSVVIGTIVGLVAGFYGKIIDDILMRATDVVLSLPGLVIILLFASVFGPSLINIIIIIAILSWAGIARVIRSVALSLKERAFVDAAIIAGASDSRLIFRHIAPNVLPYTFLYMTFGISGAIVTEAILAFLGFGDINYVTWGMMLQFLQISGHSLDAPWWLLPPGIAITLLSLSFYLIGRAFDEVVNPRLRRRT